MSSAIISQPAVPPEVVCTGGRHFLQEELPFLKNTFTIFLQSFGLFYAKKPRAISLMVIHLQDCER